MATAAHNQSYPNSAWGTEPAQAQTWSEPPFWHPNGMSRPLGIAAMVLGFALWWPVGLALLFFMIASGRIGCRARRFARGPSQNGHHWQSSGCTWTAPWSNRNNTKPASTGNHAFDEYRADTLRRMEEEQAEFSGFLERLRMAKDKAEFDQFMAERRQETNQPPRPPTVQEDGQHG